MKDAWILAIPSEWEALGTEEAPFSYVWASAVTGYWKSSGAEEVYNVVGPEADVQAIIDALGTPTVYSWDQAASDATGYDSLDVWPTDPAPILALMKDHVTYDENGGIISTEPATYENPNWGHVFLGQGQRIFAGDYSDDFSEEYL